MAGFARWLREAKNLSQSDKNAAVCATPPHLEGALLSRLSKNKLCDDYEHIDAKNDNPNSNKDVEPISYDFNNIVNDNKEDVPVVAETEVIPSLNVDAPNYVDSDKVEGLDDDVYDEELDVPSDEDLPISKAKVIMVLSFYL